MRVVIAGSRSVTAASYAALCEAMDKAQRYGPVTEVCSGGAKGADRLGERWAEEHNVPLRSFTANWGRYGRRAGARRNAEMAKYAAEGQPKGYLVALWDGSSPGTQNMIDQARRYGLLWDVVIVGDGAAQ